jgi:hypothetical protein
VCAKQFGTFGANSITASAPSAYGGGGGLTPTPICGSITFSQKVVQRNECANVCVQDYPDHRPVLVNVTLTNMKVFGDYIIVIHYTGDTRDNCVYLSGQRWHLLHEFTISVGVRICALIARAAKI